MFFWVCGCCSLSFLASCSISLDILEHFTVDGFGNIYRICLIHL